MKLRFLLLCIITVSCLLLGCGDDSVKPVNSTLNITNCLPDTVYVLPYERWMHQFTIETNVSPMQPTWTVMNQTDGNDSFYSMSQSGALILHPGLNERGKYYSLTIVVELLPRIVDTCSFTVAVSEQPASLLRIVQVDDALPGEYCEIALLQLAGNRAMGGFDLLLGFDLSALSFVSTTLGDQLSESGCQWEFFDYRYESPPEDCTGPCPSGILRLIAIADHNDGDHHPQCYGGNGELARMRFLVSPDTVYYCTFQPIRFVWADCGDNVLSNVTGDTLLATTRIYEYNWNGFSADSSYMITNDDCAAGWTYRYGGICDNCNLEQHYNVNYCLELWNGGVQIACPVTKEE